MRKMMQQDAKKSQSDKFKEAARQLGADDDEERFDATLRKILKQPEVHTSDCSMHNAPAYQSGECDCGAS
jgi:hypothetical protein